MSPTLLFDLDNTLLKNDIEAFLPHYLKAFSQVFAHQVAGQVDPDQFVRSLLAGTQAMMHNRRPDRTLRQAFEAVFYPMVGVEPARFEPLAEHFYSQVFPTLQRLTQPIPQAIDLVEACVARGYRIALATNPAFPRTAVLQRLDWAELPAQFYPFEIVASYETFHFAKPEPAFFAELLAYMGWPAGPVIVVGDDLERDVAAGRRLGLPVFWVEQEGVTARQGPAGPTAHGSLSEILPWLDSSPEDALRQDLSQPEALLAILYSTPAALDSLCRDLSEMAWSLQPQADEWGLTEIACHLRDVEREVNLPRVRRMLSESNPFIAGEDTDPWAQTRGYRHQHGPQALQQFILARMELVSVLEAMPPDCWEAPARHAIFGPTTLQEVISIQAAHDRLHIQQVHQVLKVISNPS